MVDGERALQSVSGDVPRIPVAADIVDQHMDPREGLENLTSQPPNLRLRRQVREEHVHCSPPAARISAAEASVRPWLRPVMAKCAPMLARPSAVALPMPLLPPVTSTVLPAIGLL